MEKILGVIPSPQQQDIINAIGRGENVNTEAVAGSGKSRTLLMAMKKHSNKKFLVLTFMSALNKGMRQECLDLGVDNASINTVHSLAYQAIIGRSKRYELGGYVSFKLMAKLDPAPFYTLADRKEMFNDWLSSDEPLKALPKWGQKLYKTLMSKPKISHSLYFKAYVLELIEGKINFNHFDYLVIDELNDASEAMVTLLKHCGIPIITLGDEKQSIMGFSLRGYSAYKDKPLLSKMKTYPLDMSYRCSPEIARYVQAFARAWIDPNFVFKGFADTAKFADKSYMVLSRTNAGMLGEMVELMNKGKTFKCNKSLGSLFKPVYQLLMLNKNIPKLQKFKGKYTHVEFTKNCDINASSIPKELMDNVLTYLNGPSRDGMKFALFAKKYMGNEYAVASTIIAKYAKTKGAIGRLEEKIKKHMSQKSSITVMTASSSKGMTATRVSIGGFGSFDALLEGLYTEEMRVSDDLNKAYDHVTLPEVLDKIHNGTSVYEIAAREELNLLYVAMTRCRIGFTFTGDELEVPKLLNPALAVKEFNRHLDTLSHIQGRV